jgi:hypothetical protein
MISTHTPAQNRNPRNLNQAISTKADDEEYERSIIELFKYRI